MAHCNHTHTQRAPNTVRKQSGATDLPWENHPGDMNDYAKFLLIDSSFVFLSWFVCACARPLSRELETAISFAWCLPICTH